MAAPKIVKIAIADVKRSRRGRTADINSDLLETLAAVDVNTAVSLEPLYGLVPQEKRAALNQKVRTHWNKLVEDKRQTGVPSIQYAPDGTPQVLMSQRNSESAAPAQS